MQVLYRWRVSRGIAFVLGFSCCACAGSAAPKFSTTDGWAAWRDRLKTPHGAVEWIEDAVDQTADPCKDFFTFACNRPGPGEWRSDSSLEASRHLARAELSEIADAIEKTPNPDPAVRGLRNLLLSCRKTRDSAAEMTRVIKGVREAFPVVEVRDTAEFMSALGQLHRATGSGLFWPYARPSRIDRARNVLALIQQPLVFGNPAASERNSPLLVEMRNYYRRGIVARLERGGERGPEPLAAALVDFELERASYYVESKAPKALADIPEFSVEELEALSGLPWRGYFAALELPAIERVVLEPDARYFAGLGKSLRRLPPSSLGAILRQMREGLVDAVWSYPTFRWIGCVNLADRGFASELWEHHGQRNGGARHRELAVEVWDAVKAEVAGQLTDLLGDPEHPLVVKLRSVRMFIDPPAPYSPPLDGRMTGDLLTNYLAILRAEADGQWRGLSLPANHDEPRWPRRAKLPFYWGVSNTAVIPPWSQRPPLIDADIPLLLTYAGFGAIAGHEISHALSIPWRGEGHDALPLVATMANPPALVSAEQCVAAHAGRFETAEPAYLPLLATHAAGMGVDPEQVVDETLADVLGVRAALRAFQRHPEGARMSTPALTSEQAFFVVYAQNWCDEPSQYASRILTEIDEHVPSRARANAALMLLPEFREAFACPIPESAAGLSPDCLRSSSP